MKHILRTALAVGILQALGAPVLGGSIIVRDANELQSQVRQAQPGTTITLAPGNYGNGIYIEKIHGTKEKPIIITGASDQEQPTNTFISCQQGVFENNLIVFDKRVQTFVNVGPNTKPETFSFRNNAWFCTDGNRNPTLPSKEMNGIYQINPMLENAETPELKIGSDNPRLMNVGAHAFGRQDASHVPF